MENAIGKSAVTAVLLVTVGALFSPCHSPTTPTTMSSVTVTGTVPAVGQMSQLAAKATLSNGTSQDVTTQATWSSSNTAVATVTAGGLLKVLQLGGADDQCDADAILEYGLVVEVDTSGVHRRDGYDSFFQSRIMR
jgi:Bacterial Ig-like domain (group 2)